MTNFSDQLLRDLMREHGSALREAQLPVAGPRHHLRRTAWLAGGAGTLAVGITASLAAFGGTASEAYAITPHSDGTVTVAVTDLSGVTGANATLHHLGLRVVVVPVKAGCPSIMSLPDPPAPPGKVSGAIGLTGVNGGSVTVEAHGIPAGDLLVIAVSKAANGTQMAVRLTSPPAPACVTIPPGMPGPGIPGGGGHGSGAGGAPAPDGKKVVRTGSGGAPAPGSTVVRTGSGGASVSGTAAG
jgi:hypothetical protein